MSLTCVLCIYIFTALELSPAAQRAIRSLHYDHKPLATLVLATLSGRVRQPAHTMKQMNHRLKQLEVSEQEPARSQNATRAVAQTLQIPIAAASAAGPGSGASNAVLGSPLPFIRCATCKAKAK